MSSISERAKNTEVSEGAEKWRDGPSERALSRIWCSTSSRQNRRSSQDGARKGRTERSKLDSPMLVAATAEREAFRAPPPVEEATMPGVTISAGSKARGRSVSHPMLRR